MTWPNTVTLGGILLDLDNDTSFRVVEGLSGWDDAPPSRFDLQSRSQQDGAWDAAGLRDLRVVEVEGFVQEPSLVAVADSSHRRA